MSRSESDREDLFAEAVAMEVRSEWTAPVEPQVVTIGFRATGELSVYFGQDPFYQFDVEGRLRRALVDSFLYRSQPPGLARLDRQRTEAGTTLMRHDLSPAELEAFVETMRQRLRQFAAALQDETARAIRSVPPGDPQTDRLRAALRVVLHSDPWLSNTIGHRA